MKRGIAVGEAVTIHPPVEAAIDGALLHQDACRVFAFLLKELPYLPAEDRQNRPPDEPDVFVCQFVFQAAGLWRTLDFAVNDSWEPGRLHVVGMVHTPGRRAF